LKASCLSCWPIGVVQEKECLVRMGQGAFLSGRDDVPEDLSIHLAAAGRPSLVDRTAEAVQRCHQRLVEELVLAAEVVVDRGGRYSALPGNVVDTRLGVTGAGEDLDR